MKKDTSAKTILVITLGFLGLYLIFEQDWMMYTALIVGVLGAVSDRAAVKIEWLWFRLAHILSHIIPPLLLTAVFYLFLFPVALVSRWFTKDPLLLHNKYSSTFTDVAEVDIKKSMEKTW